MSGTSSQPIPPSSYRLAQIVTHPSSVRLRTSAPVPPDVVSAHDGLVWLVRLQTATPSTVWLVKWDSTQEVMRDASPDPPPKLDRFWRAA
jgi:hypothetical protein